MLKNQDPNAERLLPQIPLHEVCTIPLFRPEDSKPPNTRETNIVITPQARQIMTRADFIQQYDQRNLFTIDSEAMVRADSVPMQNAMREICSQPGFEKHLEKTLRRLDDLESLARTRELVLKDLVKGGSYKANVSESAGLGKSVDISYVKGWTGWWS